MTADTNTAAAVASGDYPNGFLLVLIQVAEAFFLTFNFTDWRQYLPFGLGDVSSNGLFSHETPPPVSDLLPNLLTFADFSTAQAKTSAESFLSTFQKFAFETRTTSLGVLTTKDSILTLMAMVLLMRLVKRLLIPGFCTLGRSLGRQTHGLQWEKDNEEKIAKFGEYVFRLLYHSAVSIFGLWYFWDKPWWNNDQGGTLNLWLEYPNHPIDVGMTWYYMMQSAYNVDAMLSLLELSIDMKLQNPFCSKTMVTRSPIYIGWKPSVRGDFREMFVHHVITNMLVFGSSHFRFTRIGSMVFMVHDISDIPVDMSKLANFMKWKLTTIACFVSMVLVWIVTRLGILPFIIFKSVWEETPILYEKGIVDVRHYAMYAPPFFILLGSIILLHAFWFTMFIQIARDLTKGKVNDYSEHKNGEENTGTKSKSTKVE